MPNVTLFTCRAEGLEDVWMEESPNGEWVHCDDYDKLWKAAIELIGTYNPPAIIGRKQEHIDAYASGLLKEKLSGS